MELDLDSGLIRGQVLEGRYQEAAVDNLDLSALIAILGDIDDDSRQLLTAYLIGGIRAGANSGFEDCPSADDLRDSDYTKP